jgi:hypothetical protein
MKEFLFADGGKSERAGKNDIAIENGERGDQEILLVDPPEMHRVDPASFHQKNAGQHHPD